jgi:hypothetical protein
MPKKPKSFSSFSEYLAAKPSERSKPPPQQADLDNDLAQLVFMFPDIDREYARMCLRNYSQDRVARVAKKILDRNFCNYPRHVIPFSAKVNVRTSTIFILIRMHIWTI